MVLRHLKKVEVWNVVFQHRNNDEGLLANGVSATGKKMKDCWCFSNG
jgi:hypothetical protein